MENEELKLSTKEAQLQLLHQVLAASDADAQEENVKDETFDGSKEARVRWILQIFAESRKTQVFLTDKVYYDSLYTVGT